MQLSLDETNMEGTRYEPGREWSDWVRFTFFGKFLSDAPP